jgi:tRNA nucleotidyltransferase (CCA-adding enzyme)
MDIIITHRFADFDALASQVAAAKLYPGAIMIGAGGVSPIVRKFLALHKDHFELTQVKDINLSDVTRMIVVDVRRASRLHDFKPLLKRIDQGDSFLEVHIYDHHESSSDDLKGHSVTVEPVGAATTLLVEALQKSNLNITPIEATVLALGIYSDTGSLTYPSTTPRDAAAAAFLLAHGASMDTLQYFLHAPLNSRQRQIISTLLNRLTLFEINGVKIGLGTVPLQRPVGGLSEIVGEVLSLENHEALFTFFPRPPNITIIGRSRVAYVDIGNIMQELGGGGHTTAGSVTLKNTNIRSAKTALVAALKSNSPKPHLVRQMMSTPVYTVKASDKLDAIVKDFKQRKISGAPVLKKGNFVGIISKRDVLNAKRQERDHLPVSSCMIQEVKTIEPDDSLVRAFEKMAEADVGRLPVLENGFLVGIITRNDILQVLYDDKSKTAPV